MLQTRVKRVIAGPGAGKTTGLIDEVLISLPSIKPNKFLVIITYMNAATEKIRFELEKRIKIPANLFIGTIHSFLDKFILLPYGSLLEIIPNQITFVNKLETKNIKLESTIIKMARDNGIITSDQIAWISEKIISGGRVNVKLKVVNISKSNALNIAHKTSNRIQSIFVDEYQDATITQHNIFVSLIKTGRIEYFYCVGDPEQYIYGFTYRKIGRPNYKQIPLYKMEEIEGIQTVELNVNRRSQPKIINFLNNFASLKQDIRISKHPDQPEVIYINKLTQDEIIEDFLNLCNKYHLNEQVKFFLSFSKDTFNNPQLVDKLQILDKSAGIDRILSLTLKYLSGLLGYSQKEICSKKNWDEISLRKMALDILHGIRSDRLISEDDIRSILKNKYGLIPVIITKFFDNDSINFLKLKSLSIENNKNSLNIKSTIHKSKGLETDAVLVLAKTKKQLLKWLETDINKRENDQRDECRIGYVAFSRARYLLCISCLENIDDARDILSSLGVHIYEKELVFQ